MNKYIVLGKGSSGLKAAAIAISRSMSKAPVLFVDSGGGSVGGNESETEKMIISLGKERIFRRRNPNSINEKLMNALLFFIALGTALLIVARFLKVYWFVRMFFAACVSWLIALIISVELQEFMYTAGLVMIFITIGLRLKQVSRMSLEKKEDCYKYGGECKHDCPGQCRESC